MVDVVLERQFNPALSEADFTAMALESSDCLALYRVEWRESLLASDGSRLLCRFWAPDAESVRMVAKERPAAAKSAWAGTVHDTGRDDDATVVVERRFASPVTVEELQAREDAAAWCLEQHRVTFLRTFFSQDRSRMICLYRAPDEESVRLAQARADMPVERVWSCRRFSPANFAG